jgi:hypothetical protein
VSARHEQLRNLNATSEDQEKDRCRPNLRLKPRESKSRRPVNQEMHDTMGRGCVSTKSGRDYRQHGDGCCQGPSNNPRALRNVGSKRDHPKFNLIAAAFGHVGWNRELMDRCL